MIRQLTKQIGMPKSAPALGGQLVCALLLLTGCQLSPARKTYKPPSAGNVMDSSSTVVPAVQEKSDDLMNALGHASTNNSSTKNSSTNYSSANHSSANHSSTNNAAFNHSTFRNTSPFTNNAATNNAGAASNISASNMAASNAALDNAAATSNVSATTQQYLTAVSQQAQQASRFQLSPFAIVRGQSGWVPSNPSGGSPQGGSPPGLLTDATPSVTRYQPPPNYGSAVAPGTIGGQGTIAPGVVGYNDGSVDVPNITAPGGYQPKIEIAPLDVYVQEKRTGRIILGGSVNSDLGVAGQVIIDERNFDIRAFPRSWGELFSGYAFRGAGQSFRVELMPGNQVERYTVNWTTPNLFGYMPYSLSLGGFYFTRQYRDWIERRLGGRIGLAYNITKDLSIGTEIRGENVRITNPRVPGVQKLDSVLGKNELYSARVSVAHDTRDSAFLATQGSLLQLIYDQAFGDFDYPQGQVNYSKYFRVHERADGLGRHVLASTWKVGVSGTQTPIFENFYAGGFSSMRGFRFRGASPVENDVQVGGRFMFLGSLEYMFPLTADEMLRGVAFVDYGTVEQNVTIKEENFRIAPGLGLRISVPMLGPAPLAFDFSVPVARADSDQTQLLSFYMGFTR